MMIKIYKNENDELECHVNYAGYDFKFQCIKMVLALLLREQFNRVSGIRKLYR